MLTVDNPKKFDWSGMSLHDCAEGNALDSYFTLKLFDVCEKELKKLNMLHLYDSLMAPATEVFSGMEFNGLNISQEKYWAIDTKPTCKKVSKFGFSHLKNCSDAVVFVLCTYTFCMRILDLRQNLLS